MSSARVVLRERFAEEKIGVRSITFHVITLLIAVFCVIVHIPSSPACCCVWNEVFDWYRSPDYIPRSVFCGNQHLSVRPEFNESHSVITCRKWYRNVTLTRLGIDHNQATSPLFSDATNICGVEDFCWFSISESPRFLSNLSHIYLHLWFTAEFNSLFFQPSMHEPAISWHTQNPINSQDIEGCLFSIEWRRSIERPKQVYDVTNTFLFRSFSVTDMKTFLPDYVEFEIPGKQMTKLCHQVDEIPVSYRIGL